MTADISSGSSARSRLNALSPAKRALFEKRLGVRKDDAEDVITRVDRFAALPASSNQRRLWFMDQLTGGHMMFNVPVVLRLTGPLDLDVLTRSVRALFRRHESLRTVFAATETGPVQRILADIEVDLTPVPLAEGEAALRAALRAETERLFSLEQGPLARAALLRRSAEDHIFVLTVHHSVCDGWSMATLIDELIAAYVAGGTPDLKPLSIQYADYAAWENRPQHAQEIDAGLDYWRRTLSDAVPVVELPHDRPRPPVQTFRGARYAFVLPAGLWPQVREIGRAERATPFMVLLAGFAAMLARYSGQDEVSVLTPVANRPRVELEEHRRLLRELDRAADGPRRAADIPGARQTRPGRDSGRHGPR